MLFSLATAARASVAPDASPRVEAKARERAILLRHCEPASRALERDADAEAVHDRATAKAKGAAAEEAHPAHCRAGRLSRSAGAA